MRHVLVLFLAVPLLAQITPPPSGGSVCTVTGTQTTGYVLTATNGSSGCSWQAVGGASVDANVIKNAQFISDLGTANSLSGTTATTYPGYTKGQVIVIQVANTNTGATTININTLGTKAVTKNGAVALAAGNLVGGQDYILSYDGTEFEALNFTPTYLDTVALFSGCSGTMYLGADGTCHTASGGTGTPGGTSGQVQYNNAGAFGGFTVGGDGTLNTSTGALTVSSTSGHAFVASAYTDTTNASNIGSGTLPVGRLPAFTGGDCTTSAGSGNVSCASIGGKAVTLGGSFTLNGAFTTAFNVTANTNVTFPTGGTLATVSQIPTVTGGTCTNQVTTAISTSAVPTCTTVTSAYVDSSIAPTASPALTGNPTVPTQATTDSSTKAASTAYVTTAIANAIAGVNPAVAVNAATTTAANTSGLTYNNGASGVGATFTGTANTAITIDGFTFTAVGQRLLVKNDTQSPSGAFNGVYSMTVLQGSVVAPVFTRALNYDTPSDMNNTGAIPVINGTANTSTSWVLTSKVNTVGTDALTFTQFSLNPSSIFTSSSMTGHNVSSPLTCSAASASGTAYTCSTSPTFTPASGDIILFKADVANTGAATLSVNSATAANIYKQGGGTALVANDLLAGQCVTLVFDGTEWQMQGQVGNAVSSGGPNYFNTTVSAITTGNWTTLGSSCTRSNLTGAINIVSNTSAYNMCGVYTAVTGNYTHTLAVWVAPASTIYGTVLVGWTDGTKTEGCGPIVTTAGYSPYITGTADSALTGNNYSNANGLVASAAQSFSSGLLLVKLTKASSTLTCAVSFDGGYSYETIFSDTTPYLTPTGISVMTDPRNGAVNTIATLVSYQ